MDATPYDGICCNPGEVMLAVGPTPRTEHDVPKAWITLRDALGVEKKSVSRLDPFWGSGEPGGT